MKPESGISPDAKGTGLPLTILLIAIAPVPSTFSVAAPVLAKPAVKVTMLPPTSEKPPGVVGLTTCAFAEPVDVPPANNAVPPPGCVHTAVDDEPVVVQT